MQKKAKDDWVLRNKVNDTITFKITFLGGLFHFFFFFCWMQKKK